MCAFAAATLPSTKGQQGWNCSDKNIPVTTVCTWAGIKCDGSGAVTEIFLPGLYLTGSIPYKMGLVSSLKSVNLNSNSLTGSFPMLGSLSKGSPNLEYLDISQNSFNGMIPSFAGTFTSLQYLSLSDNSFSGYLPSSLCRLHHLTSLYFDNNNFVCYFGCLSSIRDLKWGSVPATCTYRKLFMIFDFYSIVSIFHYPEPTSTPTTLPSSVPTASIIPSSYDYLSPAFYLHLSICFCRSLTKLFE